MHQNLPSGHPDSANLQFNFITPYLISPHNSKTLYHAGNYVFKSSNRGDNWDVISPNLSKSSEPGKQSTAAGALEVSKLKQGLVYVGMDKGSFWVTKTDGQSWEEHSSGLPNNYIRSICASGFQESRVYMSMSGINYDDLNNYIYVSEDYGENWTSIKSNLPNEVVNVILEDPFYENILYAGLYRGLYISFDRGQSWSILGTNLPTASVSDIVIQQREKDLIISTHGRGIYMLNLSPIYDIFDKGFPLKTDFLCSIPDAKRPKLNDSHQEPLLHTVEKGTDYFLVN